MGHKVFISFKDEDKEYKKFIQEIEGLDYVDKSLDEPIDSTDEDYILQRIRSDYLADSTVTIHLIGLHGTEDQGAYEQRFIKRELQGSLYDGKNNTKSGILGIVLPQATDYVYKGKQTCSRCGESHDIVKIDNGTTIREFSYNFYIPNEKCAHSDEDRYCVLVTWEDFVRDPESHINAAFDKRFEPIADKTKVYP